MELVPGFEQLLQGLAGTMTAQEIASYDATVATTLVPFYSNHAEIV